MNAGDHDEPWLSVVGIGDDGVMSLSPSARATLDRGDLLVGGQRHLAMLPEHPAERLPWRQPLESTLDDLERWRGRRVVVLASGDPMCFGVGDLLCRRFGLREMRILPAPSTFSLVCARLGWSLPEVTTVSLHGRPLAALRRHLAPGARVVALSRDGTTPALIARLLVEAGYAPSRLAVFEHLGGPTERRIEAPAATWTAEPCADLNTVAVECFADAGAEPASCAPGLPDHLFVSDGMLTKREVRAVTHARLAALPGQLLWDVGAGSGAIAIEWLRAGARMRAIAVERDRERCASIVRNAERLGVPELEVREAEAPGGLDGLEAPDAVFIGGGIATPGLVERCWAALPSGGRLVANVVTLDGERVLLDWHGRHGGELSRLAISRAEGMGARTGWRALAPVTQLALRKP